jgi:murein L,D-transpeptidase YafK
MRLASFLRALVAILFVGLLAACQETPRGLIPVSKALLAQMEKMNMDAAAPIFIRIFKEESKLELWKQRRDGQYGLLKTYEICKWSGELGPKFVEGDRQAPEGFYTVTPAQMNPNSSYYLSFNIGYPNAYDKAWGRTGSNLMVHGACSSAGCYSMTDESAGEIFAVARDAFKGGQTAFQVHAFPFRLTDENMAKHASSKYYAFWQMLKPGYDAFEQTREIPRIDVVNKQYVVNGKAPAAGAAIAGINARDKDSRVVASVVKVETPAVVTHASAAPVPRPAPGPPHAAVAAARPAPAPPAAPAARPAPPAPVTAPAPAATTAGTQGTLTYGQPSFDAVFGPRSVN